MKKIGLLSDTHGTIHPSVSDFFSNVDEIWHAGDIGNIESISELEKIAPVRAVYGNIDNSELRLKFKEFELFTIEDLKTLIIHIGGYPGRYTPKARKLIKEHSPELVITGHSHILKVIFDKKNNLLHINPGAAGNVGFHRVITLIRFKITSGKIEDLEVFESRR
jgi:putative phosphoesterase